MRAAPAISVPLGVSGAWRGAQSLLWALAAASLCAWAAARAGHSAAWGLAALAPVALAGWLLLPGSELTLRWDGEQWQLDTQPVQPTVALDLGRFMLLSLQPTGGGTRRWLPATAAFGMNGMRSRIGATQTLTSIIHRRARGGARPRRTRRPDR